MAASKRTRSLILLAIASAAALVAAAGCMGRGGGELNIFLTGDTRGYLEPCGCRRDQAGGLPARYTLVKQTHGERLLLDVGNVTSGGRSYELLKLHYLLDGMARMGYAAVNLGRREAGLDRDTLRGVIDPSPVPFVSCNVLDRSTRRPMAEPFRVVKAAGARIGITGVAEAPDDEAGPGIYVRPAAEALAEVLPRLRAQSDFVVVLAFASAATIRAIADRFHEIDALFGGDVPQSSDSAETLNRAIAFNVTDKGKVIGRLTLRRSGNGFALVGAEALKVKDSIPPAVEMASVIREFKDRLRDQNLELAAEEGLDPVARSVSTADLYAGQAACSGCHPKAHEIGVAAAHSRAYRTLVDKKSEYDPECLRCHTVGYGARDGFTNIQRTPALAGVQCESCHGRGSEHVKAMQVNPAQAKGAQDSAVQVKIAPVMGANVKAMQAKSAQEKGSMPQSDFRAVTPNTCVRCHDRENSENFDYAVYWPRIRHGAD